MSVGANSIKRAAKTAAAEGPRENGPEAKTPERAEGGAKAAQTSRKAVQKKREPKAVKGQAALAVTDTEAAAREAAAGKQAYEAYGIGQQLPIYLL